MPEIEPISRGPKISKLQLVCIVALLATWIFYPIRNHTEAEDAYMFATNIRDLQASDLIGNPAHLLYHVFTKLIWTICGKPDAFQFIAWTSTVYGLVAVTFLGLTAWRRFQLSIPVSIITALIFASTYNVWRYSHEVETYAPAWATGMVALWLALNPRTKFWGGFIGAFFTGFHIMGALLIGPAIALAIWARDGFRSAFIYCLAVFAGLVVLFCIPPLVRYGHSEITPPAWAIPGSLLSPSSPQAGNVKLESNLQGVSLPKALLREVLAFGSTLSASNWLFFSDASASRISKVFPEKNFTEEVAIGKSVPDFLFPISLVTFILSTGMFAFIGLRAFIGRRIPDRTIPESTPARSLDWRLVLLSVWMISYFVAQMFIGAAAPESWTPLIPVTAFLFGLGLSKFPEARRTVVGVSALSLMFLHNFIGGIGPLHSEENDLNYIQNSWLVKNANQNDVVIGDNFASIDRYLNWHSKAKTIQLGQCANEQQVEELMALAKKYTKESGGRIFVRAEVLNPPAHLLALGRPDISKLTASWEENGMLKLVPAATYPVYEFASTVAPD